MADVSMRSGVFSSSNRAWRGCVLHTSFGDIFVAYAVYPLLKRRVCTSGAVTKENIENVTDIARLLKAVMTSDPTTSPLFESMASSFVAVIQRSVSAFLNPFFLGGGRTCSQGKLSFSPVSTVLCSLLNCW